MGGATVAVLIPAGAAGVSGGFWVGAAAAGQFLRDAGEGSAACKNTASETAPKPSGRRPPAASRCSCCRGDQPFLTIISFVFRVFRGRSTQSPIAKCAIGDGYSCSPEPDQIHPHETGDSGAGASRPATFRATHRTSRPLATYTPSRWDKTGRPKAAKARQSACKPARRQASRAAFRENPIHFPLDLVERRFQNRTPGIEHHVPVRPKFIELQPDRFPRPPSCPITNHRGTQCTRRCETNPRPSAIRPPRAERREVRTCDPKSVVVDLAEIDPSARSSRLSEMTYLVLS